MFKDTVSVKVKAGNGGNGLISFRHERYISKGGPDGGDGGNGGSVIAIADHNLNTLGHFRHQQLLAAEDGENGGNQKKHGKAGTDLILKVPPGTTIVEDGGVVADLTELDQEAVVARGGKGGFGNAHFKSSTRQTPRHAELGEPGQQRELTLELKLIADVGLVGLPNAGKSTLLSVVSNARPEIADYPFTTLTPHLGVVDFNDQSILFEDIPGLIEGAAAGKGLGHEFLRHIERTKVILHLIDAGSADPAADYQTVNKELAAYSQKLAEKPQIVVLTKIDTISDKEIAKKKEKLQKVVLEPVEAISSAKKAGLPQLLGKVETMLKRPPMSPEAETEESGEVPVIDILSDAEGWTVERVDGRWLISGQQLEAFASRTDFGNEEAIERLKDIFMKRGVLRELLRLGVKRGDKVTVAGKSFVW